MAVERETLDRVAASFQDFMTRAQFVDLFGRITDIDDTVNIHGNHAAAQWITMAGFCAFLGNGAGLDIALEAGADPDAGSPTALMQVAGHMREHRATEAIRMADALIAAGADVNHVSSKGGTALTSLARFAGSPSLAAHLIEAGADPGLGEDAKSARAVDFLEHHGLAPALAPGMR